MQKIIQTERLRRHQLSIHSRTHEVSCSKCEKKFARTDNLKKHMKFCCVCRQCSKNFENIKDLKDHNCFSLAYVLRNIETNELRYFHASYNNHLMLEIALLISNRQELFDFLNSIAEESFTENITRPDTKWKIIQI